MEGARDSGKAAVYVPLTLDGGAAGGSAVGRLAHALPRVRAMQRRGRCASLSGAAVAAKATARPLRSGASAADVTPSEPKVSDWRSGRAGPTIPSIQRPGIGHGG